MDNLEKFLDKAIIWGVAILAFLLPIFFLPITTNFFAYPKQGLLIVFALLLLLACIGKMAFLGRVSFKKGPFDLPIALFALVFIASTFFGSTNKLTGFLNFSDTTLILGLTVLYFVITNNFKLDARRYTLNALIISASLLSLIAIYQFIGLGEAFAPVEWLKDKAFTPAGGLLPLATFLGVSLVLALTRIYADWKADQRRFSTVLLFYCFTVLLILAGLGVSLYQLTSARPILLPQQTGWAIAIETMKFVPLSGIGPQNFINAFSQFRPIAYNLSNLWAVRFFASSNWYFHLLTTTGILGLGAFLWLIWEVVKTGLTLKNAELFVMLVLLALFPPNILLLFLLYLFLALYASQLPAKEYLEESQLLTKIFGVLVLLLVIAVFWYGGKVFAAEVYFKRSFDALAQNRGTETYNLQIKTISLNPHLDNYRVVYSQTNLALANAIASQPELSDQDRQNITQLVQQAIREAKVAIALDPNKASNWENLAIIYRQLINFAQGADDWTIAAYQQAIALDPVNPGLRLSLGGVYYGLQNWDEAIKRFELAVNLKPNFANGHYNLASVYREKGDFEKAVIAMENALSLVPVDSDDWQKANSELEALRKRLAEKAEKEAEKPSETLTPPEPLPTGIKPPLALPTGVEPEITPSPTPEATPTP